MATEILKEFLVAVGFKVDESSYKRQAEAVEKVGKQLGQIDRDDRERVTAEGRRHEVRKRNAEGLALALGGVATAAAAAATVVSAAMVKIAGGFDNLYFVSQRTGASVNNLKGIGYAFSQVGSSAESAMQAIESFARARRTNPGINAMLRSMGVDTRGDSADVMMRSVDTIQARHPYYTGAQVAGLLGISEDQFLTLTKYREQIKGFREEYARTQRALGVNSDDTARASATIQRAIGSLTATLGVLTEKLYTALAPVLERIVKGFKDWVESHPEQVEKIMQGIAHAVETVGTALTQVGDWLADEKNQKRLEDYWNKFTLRIKETAQQIKELLETLIKLGRYLGLGSSTTDDPLGIGHAVTSLRGGEGSGGTESPGIFRRGVNAVKRFFGADPGDMSGGRSSRQKGENAAGAKESYDFWRSKGLTHAQAAGLVGMEEGESNFNPRAVGDGGAAHGAFQHHPDRRAKILRGTGIDIDKATHLQQLEAAHWEMTQGDEKAAWAAIQRAGSAGAAASAGVYNFERPLDKAGEAARRGARANYWAEKFKTGSAPAAPAVTAPTFNPGRTNVNDLLRSNPMGSTTSNDNSRSVSQNNPVTVNVHGASDPQATASAVARGVSSANDMSLRNVQTAIR